MALYIDGKKIGVNQGTDGRPALHGYWRIGGDNIGGWPNQPSSNFFSGAIDDVAIYPTALGLTRRPAALRRQRPDARHRRRHRPTPTARPSSTPAPTSTGGSATRRARRPRTAARTGTTASSPAASRSASRAASGDEQHGGVVQRLRRHHRLGQPAGRPHACTPRSSWFKTSTTHGGKLIGFGNQQTGNSGAYDRHVYMENTGQLTLRHLDRLQPTPPPRRSATTTARGTTWSPPRAPTACSSTSTAARSPPTRQTDRRPTTGYWRVGGDSDWGGGPAPTSTAPSTRSRSTPASSPPARCTRTTSPAAARWPTRPPRRAFTDSEAGPEGVVRRHQLARPRRLDRVLRLGLRRRHHRHGRHADHTYATPALHGDADGDRQPGRHRTRPSASRSTSPNTAPDAAFTTSTYGLTVSVDGSASSDPDGTIASYAWDCGDGTTGTGVTATHTYAATGTYTVTLTVTDNDGGTATTMSRRHGASGDEPAAGGGLHRHRGRPDVRRSTARAPTTRRLDRVLRLGLRRRHLRHRRDARTHLRRHRRLHRGADGDRQPGRHEHVVRSVSTSPQPAPNAAFTSSVNGSSVSVNGSGVQRPRRHGRVLRLELG